MTKNKLPAEFTCDGAAFMTGDLDGLGQMRVTVTPEQITVEFIRAYVGQAGQVMYSYII